MQSSPLTTVDDFIEAFIAALVDCGTKSVDPNSESTNQGISRIFALLGQLAMSTSEVDEKRWLQRIRNLASPSNIGTYDYFLSALRSRQLGFVSSPNPRYSEICFNLSRPQARQVLNGMAPSLRNAAQSAAAAFLQQENSSGTGDKTDRGEDVSDENSRSTGRLVW